GEVLRIVRAGKETAEKNGTDPWLLNFREALLRTAAYDFDGARRLCDFITRPDPEYPTEQPKTIALIAGGYSALHRAEYAQAIESLKQVRDPQPKAKFFLHWFFRMLAQLGLSKAWLESGNLVDARSEAQAFLESALSTADPSLQALAWELKARIAIAEKDWNQARDFVEKGLTIIKQFDIPVAAWQVHDRAWELHQLVGEEQAAETHRAYAVGHILAIANSFSPEEPLREVFLSAAPVRRILEGHERQRRTKRGQRKSAASDT